MQYVPSAESSAEATSGTESQFLASSLDSVLDDLYDHVVKGKDCDVGGLLGRYRELTGKDRPAFMG